MCSIAKVVSVSRNSFQGRLLIPTIGVHLQDLLWKAAEAFQDLRKRGEPTGENDLWTAATALVAGQPLVTANAKDFQKIRGLLVLSHSSGA
jgi:hypothetical protein